MELLEGLQEAHCLIWVLPCMDVASVVKLTWLCASTLSHRAGGASRADRGSSWVLLQSSCAHITFSTSSTGQGFWSLTLSINLWPTPLHWQSGELPAKTPGLPWSVSALSHASLQRRLMFSVTVSKTVKHVLLQARGHCSF